MKKAIVPRCPETGRPMRRGVRSLVLTYDRESEEVAMPGWYSDACDAGVHTPEDMAVSDRVLASLKERVLKRRAAPLIDASSD